MYTCRLIIFWECVLLAILRIIVVFIAFIIVTITASIISLFYFKSTNNVYRSTLLMRQIPRLLGLTIEVRIPPEVKALKSAVYIANHQNSYDIFTISAGVQPNTLSVGKKSLKWIPFFGQMYWLSGNILIDRKNTSRAIDTITVTAERIKQKGISVWLFPEGTRSNGTGLQPFKTGAFRTAVLADVPVVPVCLSNVHEKIKWNKWNNGKLIIELLPPVTIVDTTKEGIRQASQKIHDDMLIKLNEISLETGTPYPEFKRKVKK